MTRASTAHVPPVQLVDLAAELEQVGPDLEAAVLRVLRSGRYVLGPEVEAFEEAFARAQRTPHAIGVASGTDAIILALRAAGVGPGDRVLTSPFTFFASAACIAWLGARPVLADVDPQTALVTPDTAREALERSPGPVRALLPVHLYGQLVDLHGFRALADEMGAKLVEDAAQAHGAERDGLRAGEVGDAACFSFYPTKNLGCAGDGGAILTRDDELAARLRRLRDHGSPTKYVHSEVGTNSRLAAVQAAVLALKLPHLEGWNARRRELAARYDRAFDGCARVRPLAVAAGSRPVYHQYTLRLAPGVDREELLTRLAERGIGAAVHYPSPVHLQEAAAAWGYGPGDLPAAEDLARCVLCLPVHPFLADADVERVAAALRELTGD